MKVLLLNDFALASGAESHLTALSSALAEQGVDVASWCYDRDSATLSWQRKVAQFKPDILHIHNFWRLVGEAEQIFHQSIPIVLSLHDYASICPSRMRLYQWRRCPTPCHAECGATAWQQHWHKLLQPITKVTFNRYSAEIFQQLGMDIQVIPHGIDLALWPAMFSKKQAVGFVQGHPSYWWKGLDVAKHVAAGYPFLSLAGGHPQTDVLALYHTCEVVLLPGIYDETFGLVALEAVASGCIVLGYDNAGLKALAEAGLTETVPIGEEAALKQRLAELMSSDNEALKREHRRLIQRGWQSRRMAEDYVKLYQSLM